MGYDELSHLRLAIRERDEQIQSLQTALDTTQSRADTLEEQLLTFDDRDLYRLSVGATAHNFNNMLTVILSHIQLTLADLERGHPNRRDLDDILAAVRHARHLACRMIRWDTTDHAEIIDPNVAVADLARMLRSLLSPDIEIRMVLSPETPPIEAPPRALLDALFNVALNARDAMSEGALTLATRAEGEDVVVEIVDTGPGMAPNIVERIFEPYFTTKGEDGFGLGLVSVTMLFERTPGRVDVASVEGEGTAFQFSFPRAGSGVFDQNGN